MIKGLKPVQENITNNIDVQKISPTDCERVHAGQSQLKPSANRTADSGVSKASK